MKNIVLFLSVTMLLGCSGTQNNAEKTSSDVENTGETASSHTSQNSIDWDGTYRGILPCENCEGIIATVSLTKDLTFKQKLQRMGESGEVVESAGKFHWNKNGMNVTLLPTDKGDSVQYFVGENTLTQLDTDGNKVGGNEAVKHVLSKANFDILEKYWKLAELNGKSFMTDSTFRREAHIVFKEENNRMTGNGGCNTIGGVFRTEGQNRISISNLISTKMACPRMDLETEFLNSLQKAHSFSLNGDTLALIDASNVQFAQFNAVYMK